MKLIEYQTRFKSIDNIDYEIGVRIPNRNYPLSDFGVEIFTGAIQSKIDRSILDITDFGWEYDSICAETHKAISCKVKFNLEFLPPLFLDAFESGLTSFTINGETIPDIKVIIPPSYLIIRKAKYTGGEMIPIYSGSGEQDDPIIIIGYEYAPKTITGYYDIGILCQQTQSKIHYNPNSDYEVEYIELGKQILENITFDVVSNSLSSASYRYDKKYLDFYSGGENSEPERFIYTEIDNKDFYIYWYKLAVFHEIINNFFLSLNAFHLGLDYFNIQNTETIDINLLPFKQSTNHSIGTAINFEDLYFIAYIKNGNTIVGGRLASNEKYGFIQNEKNAYNYFSKLAAQTRTKLIIDINGIQSKFYLSKPYNNNNINLIIDENAIFNYDYDKEMENRFNITASNIDNLEYDIEKFEHLSILSDNAQSVETQMIWNSRAHSNSINFPKKYLNEYENDITKKYGLNKLETRFTDLFYLENEEMERVHESIGINLGSWKLDNGLDADFKVYNGDTSNLFFEMQGVYQLNEGALIYSQNYSIAKTCTFAGAKNIPIRYYTIQTYLSKLQANYDGNIMQEFDFIMPKINDYMFIVNANLKFLETGANRRYSFLSSKISSLRTGEIELNFGRVV
jgi:hypothetical protein